MDEEAKGSQTDWLAVFKANQSFFIFLGIGVLLFLIGAYFFFQERLSGPSITFSSKEASLSASASSIKVDVSGAVIKPGVYELTGGARVQDGLAAAGGMTAGADREFVSKNLNLAARLTDGVKIYIPKKGETVSSVQGAGYSLQQTVNINTASEGELDKLPGVGSVTAQKIIAGRPYLKIEDLLEKKILGQSAFEKIKDKITIN